MPLLTDLLSRSNAQTENQYVHVHQKDQTITCYHLASFYHDGGNNLSLVEKPYSGFGFAVSSLEVKML